MRVGGQRHAPAALTPGKIPSSHCIGGWVNQRAGLDGCRKSCSHWHSIPGPSSPWQAATPTTISGPLYRAMRRRIPETRRTEINLLFVFGHSQNPGVWSPGHLKLISVAPNIFSIITAVLILPYKRCVS